MLAMITNCVAITYIKHAYVYVYIYVILSCTAPSLSMYTYNKHSFMQCYRAGTNFKFSLRTFGNKIFEWFEASVIHKSCAHTCMSCLCFIFPIPFGKFISILLA